MHSRKFIDCLLLAMLFVPGSEQVLAQSRPNLLILSLDTTRADQIGGGGLPLPTMPNLDRLIQESCLFSEARSVIPLTGPAHASLFTGLLPHDHGALRNQNLLRPDVPTLAELLREQGYQTAGFVSGWTLHSHISGVHRGFSLYDEQMTDQYKITQSQRHADEVTNHALAWLKRRTLGQPFFLFVHFFDAHDPYEERAPWYDDFLDFWVRRHPNKKAAKKLAAYDSELAFIDTQLGRLLEELREEQLLDSTWIVLVADHGEAFGEQDVWRHGRRVYESTLRIPLLLRPPHGLTPGRLVGKTVSIVDVMPTLLEELGLPSRPSQGQSLSRLLRGEDSRWTQRPIYFETYSLWSLLKKKLPYRLGFYQGRWKVILDPRQSKLELFDLAKDPGELDNVSPQHPEFDESKNGLLEWWRRSLAPITESKLSEEDQEKLRQLGYAN